MMTWVEVTGWTLVHFLWQGALIGMLTAALLRALRHRTPGARYTVTCVALGAMLASPVVTAVVLTRDEIASEQRLAPQLFEIRNPLVSPAVPSEPGGASPTAARALGRSSTAASNGLGFAAWLPLVVSLWIAGVAVLLIRLAGGWWRVRRLHRVSLASPPSRWTDAANRMAGILRLRRIVHVVDSSLVDTPTMIGWVTPVILLPIAALASLTPAQVEAILAHELAHIRRHDFLVNLLQTFAETALFYHPAVWWMSARIREERELCCDLVATSASGDAVGYAEALVELARWRTTDTALAVSATGGTLVARIRRLLGVPAAETRPAIGAMALAIVAAMLVGVVGATQYLLAAQPEPGVETQPVTAGDANDPAAWHMVFNHDDMEMRFVGFKGRDLIRFAYQIPEARVIGGPQWMDEEILNIVVSLDAAPRADEMPAIVRRALEERLGLQTHIEQRNFPVLALEQVTLAPLGPSLRVSTTDCFDLQTWIEAGQPPRSLPPASPRQPVCGEEQDSRMGRTRYIAISMQQFADELRGYVTGWVTTPGGTEPQIGAPLDTQSVRHELVALRRPDIVDRTGLTGRYDIELHAFAPTAALMGRYPFLTGLLEPLGFSSIPRALEDQLGLRLVESEAPYDVIVIDRAERP